MTMTYQVGCVPCKVGTVTTSCCGVTFVRGSSFSCGCSLENIVGAHKTGTADFEPQYMVRGINA